jgi:hypothetical protein
MLTGFSEVDAYCTTTHLDIVCLEVREDKSKIQKKGTVMATLITGLGLVGTSYASSR